MKCCDLRLNLALANVLLLPVRVWFDFGFWLVSDCPTVLKGSVFGK